MEYNKAALPDAIYCPKMNPAKLACLNPLCEQPNFACMQQMCNACSLAHINCKLISAKGLLERIKIKEIRLTPQKAKAMRTMQNVYQEQIQNLFQRKQSMLTQMQYFGLNPFQAEFYKMISQGRTSQITGNNIMSKVSQHIYQKGDFMATEQGVLKYWKKRKAQFEQFAKKVRNIQNIAMIKLDSKITEDFETLSYFFQEMPKIYNIELLFRASENQFSAAKFHNICDNKKHTLVIIQTQFGKIIGGYTPLPWHINGDYSMDLKRQTFLFSLTNRQKYELLVANEAIYGDINCGPTFGGGHDIYIANVNALPGGNRAINNYEDQDDEDQQQEQSYFNFPHSFAHKGLNKASNITYQSFSGQKNGDYYCRVKQYEVFQLEFQ